MKYLKTFNEEYMYTFNLFCFGLDLSADEKLNNDLHYCDVEFNTKINGKEWEVDFPYHGGQCDGDLFSCVFGTIVSDSDNNPSFVSDIRSAKGEDYKRDYEKFIDIFLNRLREDSSEPEIKDILDRLEEFINHNKPCFYSVEASS